MFSKPSVCCLVLQDYTTNYFIKPIKLCEQLEHTAHKVIWKTFFKHVSHSSSILIIVASNTGCSVVAKI